MNHKINNAEKLTPVDDWLVGHFPLTMLLFGFQNAAKKLCRSSKISEGNVFANTFGQSSTTRGSSVSVGEQRVIISAGPGNCLLDIREQSIVFPKGALFFPRHKKA